MSHTKLLKMGDIYMYQNIDEPLEIILSKQYPEEGSWKKIGTYTQYQNATGPCYKNMGFE